MDDNLNYVAAAHLRTKDGAVHGIHQTCIAGDPSTGGHISTVQCGVIVHGPLWSFRVGPRTEELNEDRTAPEPEWTLTVVERPADAEQ